MDEITEIEALLRDVTSMVTGAFEVMEWGEDETQKAMNRHPAERDTLYHSFVLLTQTHPLMVTEFVYRAHCRELLERVYRGADTRPGTAVEVVCLLQHISQIAPLKSPAAGLYHRMWAAAFPGKRFFLGDSARHHEALEGSTIDDYELEARHKLMVMGRKQKLTEITCTGRHNGGLVQCKYVGR